MKFIKRFQELSLDDVALVGGKNASLGHMISNMLQQGIRVPTGFAITAQAYWHVLRYNKIEENMQRILSSIMDYNNLEQVRTAGSKLRELVMGCVLPHDLATEVTEAYTALSAEYGQLQTDVAVRSSATAEDLPNASFAGQQETFLNISGYDALLESYKKSLASLFTDRALVYRHEKGFDHVKVALSTGVQKMIRSDKATSGVIFTLDTDTGFPDVVVINAAYGLGELVVKGEVVPDEYWTHKKTVRAGFNTIIKKQLGSKNRALIYAADGDTSTAVVCVSSEQQTAWCLQEDEIIELSHMAMAIEDLYSLRKGSWCPMDIEWAKDGIDGKLYIIQARPETIHSNKTKQDGYTQYRLASDAPKTLLAEGMSIGQAIATGKARVVRSVHDSHLVQEGDIIVTQMTDPDWVPVLKKAAGIITEQGGRTCHAAIVSRELGIAAIVGAAGATVSIPDGSDITIDCSDGSRGSIYAGRVPFVQEAVVVDEQKKAAIATALMVNIAHPDNAFKVALRPNDGVGLARTEFIISNAIKIHPMACIYPERVTDVEIRKGLYAQALPHTDLAEFFVMSLARGIATIAAAFYPKPVIVRTSDFKSNEYRNLVAGTFFEPTEENPMIGLRGASRYYHASYKDAFYLECEALKKVRNDMGLRNVKIMLPFVRTIGEAEHALAIMKERGLERGRDGLEIIMMCEIPSNVLLIDQFSALFDGFSIGSNDLTQLTLGVDRDSAELAGIFDERDPAVQKMLELAISGAQRNKRPIGICGQAPSDYPEIARMLIALGINSISLNPDTIVPFINRA